MKYAILGFMKTTSLYYLTAFQFVETTLELHLQLSSTEKETEMLTILYLQKLLHS